MSGQTASKATRGNRSPSAQAAHQARIVTATIELNSSPAQALRERVMARAARNSAALGMLAGMVWIYDVARVLRG